MPPTILIGFGDDNRLVHTDPLNGNLIVKDGYISPKTIIKFINKHMVRQHKRQTIEERLIFPKFVIRLASKTSTSNEVKFIYSTDTLLSDLMSYWGSSDMAIQLFIK